VAGGGSALPQFQSNDKDFSLMQNAWATILNPVIALPINKGLILKNIALVTGSNKVNHRLGRKLQGWFLVRKRGSADIYDEQDSNQMPSLTLSLNSSADVTVDIFVF
jgi:predicted RNA binding protein YcfA (HicA-like mRNA interferase family)